MDKVGDFSFGGNTVVCSSGSPELAVTPLVEIGVVLRQTREACSMTLREVAETLNIFERHLRKLEAGELPDVALTFARGYLKNYASFLKLDSDFIVHSFDLQTRPKTDVELTEACDLNIDNARVDIGRAVQSPIVILQVLLQKALGGRSSWSNDGFQSPFNLLNAVTSAALPLLLLCVVAVAYYSVDAERLESENTVIASMQSPSASPEQLGPLASEAIASAKPIAVISPAASKAERNWHSEGYAKIADHFIERGFAVVICGGPTTAEKLLAEEINTLSQHTLINLVGETTLKQLLAILKLAHVVIAPDTGPAHMAVTVGTPVIGLYAHSNPHRTGPYLYQDYVVSCYQSSVQQQYKTPVAQLPWGIRAKGNGLMNAITVGQVKDKIKQVIADHYPELQ